MLKPFILLSVTCLFLLTIQIAPATYGIEQNRNDPYGFALSDPAVLLTKPALSPIEPENVTHLSQVSTIPNVTFVNDLAWSPRDENILAVATGSEIRVYDTDSPLIPKAILRGHTDTVNSVIFSPDGTLIASGSDDGTIRIWNIRNESQQAVHKAHLDFFGPQSVMSIYCVAFSPDGKFLAYGTEAINDIFVWDIQSDMITTYEDNPNGFVKTVIFNPDGSSVIGAGGWYSTILSWDMKSGKELPPITGHHDGIYKLAFDRGGTLLASVGWDKTIQVWDMKLNKLHMVSQPLDDTLLTDVSFNYDGTLIACGGIDGVIHVLEVKSANELMKVNDFTDFKPMNVVFNLTGILLAVVDRGANAVQLWGVK